MAWRSERSATEPQPTQSVALQHDVGSAERDAKLYAGVVERRHDAFAELYERYFHELYDFAARITHDRTAAADIVQSVFATVWERAGRGEQVRAPRAWLFRLTHNAAIDEVRRRRWTNAEEADDPVDFAEVEDVHADEPTQIVIDKEVAELVWSTAARMRPDEYGLLDLYVRRELGPDELAEQLGIAPGALYTRLSRLRRSFEDALAVTLLARRGGRDCEVLGALVAELGAGADTEAGARRLRDHVSGCADCGHARSRYVTASEILAGLAPVPLIPGVQAEVWASLGKLLGLGAAAAAGVAAAAHGGAGAGASAATAHGPVASVMGAASANPVAAVAAVAAAVAVGVGSWAAVSALRPAASDGVARDPARFFSPTPGALRASGKNRITISWTRLAESGGYSILWSHGAKDEPDALADLPGTATRTTSRALPPGTWYFHLRTRGLHDWTHTVHLGPFVIVPAAAPKARSRDAGAKPSPVEPKAEAAPRVVPTPAPETSAPGPPTEPAAPATPAPPAEETPAVDLTPPSGQGVALAGGLYYRSLSVLLALRPGTDRDSGIDSGSGVVERSAAPLARGSCGAWGAWSPVTLRASADTAVADGHCYRYRYRISDRAGNESGVSPPSAAAMVDTTPPALPALTVSASGPDTAVVGGSVFYRPAGGGGTFTVTASSDDSGSGLAAIEFPGLGGGIAPSAATRRAAEPYQVAYTWSSGASESGVVRVTAFDRAGNTAVAELALAPDAVSPEGLSVELADGAWRGEASVPLSISEGSDSGSGTAPGSVAVERESAPLGSGICGAFGAWTTVALTGVSDTTVADGACYRYRVSAADRVGNVATSEPSETARLDLTPPSAPLLTLLESSAAIHVSDATVFYRPAAGGSLTVAAASQDLQSGLARVTFPTLPGAGGGGDDQTAPYEAHYDWSALGAAGSQTVTATNAAGRSATSAFTLIPDATGPAGVSVTTALSADGVALTIEQGSDAGSGVDAGSLVFERDTATLTGGSCTFADAWTTVTLVGGEDTTVAGGTCYRYRVGVGDNVGNRTTSAPTSTVFVDGTPPSAPALMLQASSPETYVSGGTVFYRAASGSFTVSATSSDADSGIAEIVFPPLPGSSGGGSVRSAPFLTSYGWTALVAPWPATAEVTARNAVGLAASSTFTLTRDDTGPEVVVTADREGESRHIRVQVSASDAGSGLAASPPVIERDSAPMHDKVCGAFSGTWTQVTLDSKDMDPTALEHTCYRYRATVADNVGNTTRSAPVDAT